MNCRLRDRGAMASASKDIIHTEKNYTEYDSEKELTKPVLIWRKIEK